MKIIYDYSEVCEALFQYVENQGFSVKNKDVEVDLETEGGRNSPRTYHAIIEVGKKSKKTETVKVEDTNTTVPVFNPNDPIDPEEPAITPGLLGTPSSS